MQYMQIYMVMEISMDIHIHGISAVIEGVCVACSFLLGRIPERTKL